LSEWLKNWEFHPQSISHPIPRYSRNTANHIGILRKSKDFKTTNGWKKWKVSVAEIPVIAIVDDDESVREALESLMKSVGYIAKVFPSAGDFLSLGHLDDTSCMILDVQMPGMSGLELQSRLIAAKRRIPIIFISAHSDADARARAIEAGAVGFLQKPFSEDALLNAIDSCLTDSHA
jgi:FixJ family two-component response regulator